MRLAFSVILLHATLHAQYVITTFAGNGVVGVPGDGGPALSASLSLPNGVAVDAAGNVYIADPGYNRIRKVDTSGRISTLAGTGVAGLSGDGGPANTATIQLCTTAIHQGIAVDRTGNVYFSDCANNRVRKVDARGVISTVAGRGRLGSSGFSGDGGSAVDADLNSPNGLAVDRAGNLYIADTGNGRIRRVDSNGIIFTAAGGAQFTSPTDVAVDESGGLYIADAGASAIRKFEDSGGLRTLASAAAGLGIPAALAIDSAGTLYIADRSTKSVRKLERTGALTTIAGGGANTNPENVPATSAALGTVQGVAVDALGSVYIADTTAGKLRRVITATAASPIITAAVNSASFSASQPLAAGMLASLFGSELAPLTLQPSVLPLPTSLAGVSVTIQGIPAPLLYISPGQINLQVPWTLQSGLADIVVSVNGTASAKFSATVDAYSPALFTAGTYAIAINPDGSLAAPVGAIGSVSTHPARPGEVLIVLATGLGLVSPTIPAGMSASDNLRRTILTPTVLIGGVRATVSFSGLSPEFVGVNQLNVIVPDVAPGAVALQIEAAGFRTSDRTMIYVGPR